MPWLFGTPRVAPNLIQHDDFTPVAHTENQQAGGKGGGGGSTSTTSYTYTAAIIMSLCRGPIVGVGRIWIGKEQKSAQQLNLDVYGGTSNQTPHPHWLTKHSGNALAYRNMAYAASAKYDLGDDGEVPSHNFEIFTPTRISSTQPDANPAVIIQELISNKVDGLGIDVSKIANLQLFSDFCMSNGIWISPCYDEQQAAHDLITRIAEIGHSAVVVSEGKVKLIPYADTFASGNGASFTPNNAPVYDLTEDDFLTNSGQPIKMTRSSQADADNHFQITYYDRNSEYNEATAEAQDQAHIEKFGLRTKEPEEYHEICDGAVAQKLVNFKKDRSLSIRTTYEFQLSMRYALLEPMDIVTLTLAQDGLDHLPVRITEIEEDDDGNLSIKAEECPLGSQSPTQQIAQTSLAGTIDFNVSAGNINAPVIFEPSLQLTRGSTEIWAAVSGGQNWGGAQVWVSLDNQTYQKVGTVNAPSRQGVLTASLAAGSAIDTANTLKVSTDMSRGALLSATEQEALDLITLCYADGELLSYKDAQLTGVNTYDLSYLVRGLYGTEIAAHNAGTKFARLDEATFKYPYKPEWVGKTVYLKFVSYNRYGAGEQSLADVVAYPYTIMGAPLKPVGNLAFEKPWVGSDAKLRWDLVEGAERYEVQVFAGTPTALVRQISTVTEGRFTYTLDMARQDGGTWRTIIFKVRPVSITGNVGQWAQIMATNPQIGPLSGLRITEGIKQAYLEFNRPAEGDWAGACVWISTSSPVQPVPANLVYDGSGNYITIAKTANGEQLEANATYYLRAAGYDEFGKDALNVSSELTFSVFGMAPEAGSITAVEIADNAITTPKLLAGAVTADKILVNSITGDRITANTITGDKIKANTITANNIQAGSISADKLMVGASSNMLVNAGFESNFYGWNTYEPRVPATKVFNLDPAWMIANTSNKTFAINYVGGGAPASADMTIWQDILVEPGKTYICCAYVGVHRCAATMGGYFLNASDAYIDPLSWSGLSGQDTTTETQGNGGKYLSGYKRIARRFTAPANAVKLRFEIVKNGNVAGTSDSWMFVTRPYAGECLPNQTDLPPWDSAGATIIGPGSVKTDTLSAITANLGAVNAGSLNINNRFIVNSDGSTLIRSGTGGQRTEIDNQQFRVYDGNGVLRVRLGIW